MAVSPVIPIRTLSSLLFARSELRQLRPALSTFDGVVAKVSEEPFLIYASFRMKVALGNFEATCQTGLDSWRCP